MRGNARYVSKMAVFRCHGAVRVGGWQVGWFLLCCAGQMSSCVGGIWQNVCASIKLRSKAEAAIRGGVSWVLGAMLVLGPMALWLFGGALAVCLVWPVRVGSVPCKNPVQKIAVKKPDQKSLLVGNQVPLMSHLVRCVLARYILARYISPQLESDYARVCRCLYMRVHFESPVLLNSPIAIRLIMASV